MNMVGSRTSGTSGTLDELGASGPDGADDDPLPRGTARPVGVPLKVRPPLEVADAVAAGAEVVTDQDTMALVELPAEDSVMTVVRPGAGPVSTASASELAFMPSQLPSRSESMQSHNPSPLESKHPVRGSGRPATATVGSPSTIVVKPSMLLYEERRT